MKRPSTFESLMVSAEQHGLYKDLIRQLNKDLRSANIDLEFNEETLPTSLKLLLEEAIYQLIHDRFDTYLNLLYIIDVPEDEVRKIDGNESHLLASKVTFLILKREWQKVWYRKKL